MAAQLILTNVRFATPAAVVDGASHQLLAGPGLAEEEHCRIRRRDHLHLLERSAQRTAVADDLLEAAVGADLTLQVQALLCELVPQLRDLLKRKRVGDGHRDLSGDPLDAGHDGGRDGIGLNTADDQRAEHGVAHDQRHAAECPDAHPVQGFAHLGEPNRQLRPAEYLRAARGKCATTGRARDRQPPALGTMAIAGSQRGRMEHEVAVLWVVERQRGELVRDRALERRGNGRDQAG